MDRNEKRGPRLLIWLMTASLVATGVLFRNLSAEGAEGSGISAVAARPDPGEAVQRTFSGPRRTGAGPGTRGASVPVAAGAYVLPGDTYETVVARLAPRAATDSSALLVLYDAAAACAQAPLPGWRGRVSSDPRARIFLDWKERFCRGRVTTVERGVYEASRLAGMIARHPDWSTFDEDHAVPYEIVLDSPNLEDADLISGLLEADAEPWPFAMDLVEGTAYEKKAHVYQHIALEDLRCGETGECGPDGPRTAWLCAINLNAVCKAGQSVADMWRDEFSPDELNIIGEIEQRIVDERLRRQAGLAGHDR